MDVFCTKFQLLLLADNRKLATPPHCCFSLNMNESVCVRVCVEHVILFLFLVSLASPFNNISDCICHWNGDELILKLSASLAYVVLFSFISFGYLVKRKRIYPLH